MSHQWMCPWNDNVDTFCLPFSYFETLKSKAKTLVFLLSLGRCSITLLVQSIAEAAELIVPLRRCNWQLLSPQSWELRILCGPAVHRMTWTKLRASIFQTVIISVSVSTVAWCGHQPLQLDSSPLIGQIKFPPKSASLLGRKCYHLRSKRGQNFLDYSRFKLLFSTYFSLNL